MICANAAAQPFPGIGFQITNEEVLTDDLPCYEQKTNVNEACAHFLASLIDLYCLGIPYPKYVGMCRIFVRDAR